MESELVVERLSEYSPAAAAGIGRLMPFLSERLSGDSMDASLLCAIIESPAHDQFVARIRSRIVGAATMSIVMGASGRQGHLGDFVTDPNVRGQGVGTKIWHEILGWCTKRELDSFSFTSHPGRTAAHSFYRGRGAEAYDTTLFRVLVQDSIKENEA